MKTIVLGDKFVFLGDYFDSFSINTEAQVENFKDLLSFSDNGYLYDIQQGYSGFNYERKKILQQAVEDGIVTIKNYQ